MRGVDRVMRVEYLCYSSIQSFHFVRLRVRIRVKARAKLGLSG